MTLNEGPPNTRHRPRSTKINAIGRFVDNSGVPGAGCRVPSAGTGCRVPGNSNTRRKHFEFFFENH